MTDLPAPKWGAKGPIPVKVAAIMPIIDAFIDNDATWTLVQANWLSDVTVEIKNINFHAHVRPTKHETEAIYECSGEHPNRSHENL